MNFFKRKGSKALPDDTLREKLAARIAATILNFQRRIADEMNFRTRNQSPKEIMIWLVTYCLLTGSFCGYILIRAIFH